MHGSLANGEATWAAQRPLAESFELVVPNRRGFPPGPDVEAVDFEDEAVWLDRYLEPGTHLVGHSYGGVISLLIAARQPVRSLTVNEPPAFGVARGNPAVEDFLAQVAAAPRDPRGYLEHFLPLVGSALGVPDPLPPPLEAGARAATISTMQSDIGEMRGAFAEKEQEIQEAAGALRDRGLSRVRLSITSQEEPMHPIQL